MKRRALFAVMASVSLALSGCGSDTEVDLGSRPQFADGVNTATVFLYDGITGAGLSGATITVRVGPNLITATAEGNAYTVTNVPAGTVLITAIANGYFDFVGAEPIPAPAEGSTATLASPAYNHATIVMFPTSTTPRDIKVNVVEASTGTPVTGGQLMVAMKAGSKIFGGGDLANPIAGTYGYQPNVQALTLSAGTVTISGASLVYGATYDLLVLGATVASGWPLTQSTSTTLNPLTSHDEIVIEVGIAADGQKPYVLNSNNEGGAHPKTLVVNFGQQVVLCSGATGNYAADGSGSGSPGYTLANPSASVALSNNGTTLTVTPIFENPPINGIHVDIDFSGIELKLEGTNSCVLLSGLYYRGDVDADLNMTITYTQE